jgi:hypothetical protein
MKIIEFPDTRENLIRRNNEAQLPDFDKQVWLMLTQTPDNIQWIIDKSYTNNWDILIVNQKEFKALIIDYIISKLKENKVDFWKNNIMWANYLSEVLYQFFLWQSEEVKMIIDNPYYTHWMEKWFPKRAWDSSVYSYVFRDFSRKPIKKDDYIWFAQAWYVEWSHNYDFAYSISNILLFIWDMIKDNKFLNRWLRLIKK